MAEVIKRANDKWSLEADCVGCDSTIKYDEKDLVFHAGFSDQREQKSYPDYCTVECPVCGRNKRIEINGIPKLAIDNAKKRPKNNRNFNGIYAPGTK